MDLDQRSPVPFQQGDHIGPPEHRGEHDGRDPSSVVGMNVGTVPEEQFRKLEMSLEGNSSQRSLPLGIPTINIGTRLQEHPGGLEMAMVGGKQEQGISTTITEIRREPLPEHAGQRVRLAATGPLESQQLEFMVTRLLLGTRDDALHGKKCGSRAPGAREPYLG